MFTPKYWTGQYWTPKYWEPALPVSSGGGKTKKAHLPAKKPSKKPLTEEELQGLIAFGNAQMGIKKPVEVVEQVEVIERIAEVIPEIEESGDISLIQFLPEIIELKEDLEGLVQEQKEIDDDIELILALIVARNSQF